METWEFDEKKSKLKAQYDDSIKNLYKDYVNSTCKFKVGDIIHQIQTGVIIVVEKIGVYIGMEKYPTPSYHGKSLTKKLLPMKNNSTGSIYGDDHVEHLGYDN